MRSGYKLEQKKRALVRIQTMKTTASTLGFYILFLAILPSLVHLIETKKDGHQSTSLCLAANSCENKSGNSKDDDRSNSKRTPFFGCPKMHVVIPTAPVLTSKPAFNVQHLSYYSYPGVLSSYTSVWHPPKVTL